MSATDSVTIGTNDFAVDTVTLIDGTVVKVARDKIGFGVDNAYVDVSATNPLPVLNADVVAALATLSAALETITVANPTDVSALATQTTLAAVLAKLTADPATQTTLATVAAALAGTLTTSPTSAGDVAATLTDGRKTVTTPGTAVALRATLTCKWVCVTALKTNTDQVNVGGTGVLATTGSSTGQPLGAGESVTIPVNDAAKVFVDARVATEGVSFTVGA